MLQLPPIYPITDGALDVSLAAQIQRLGDAGFPLVQFRGKPQNPRTQWEELREALAASHENAGWPLICVNDRSDLAVLAAREGWTLWGLHLGQDDLPPAVAKELPGLAGLHFGTSTHLAKEWEQLDAVCDHAGVGPFRATGSKGDHLAPIGLLGLRAGCRALRSKGLAPIAIGGLTLEDAKACFDAGAESLAMIREVARALDPSELLWQAQLDRWAVRPPLRKGQGVALVGGSGCGKSTLAKELGVRLGLPVKDLDEVIVQRAGKPIARIFEEDGEPAFRRLEADVTAEAFQSPAVLALGGGAWESTAIRAAARESEYPVLWIAENPARVWARIAHDPVRPLAQERSVFIARWRSRTARWMEAPMVLPLGRSASELAEALVASL
ncbi:MAG TPA: shikimate kinase [Holophaga sp.]|nr:shikimate kinase [Holophaga sp.]